jgi:hypothetical protein
MPDFSFISDPNRVFGGQNQAIRQQEAIQDAIQKAIMQQQLQQQMQQSQQLFPLKYQQEQAKAQFAMPSAEANLSKIKFGEMAPLMNWVNQYGTPEQKKEFYQSIFSQGGQNQGGGQPPQQVPGQSYGESLIAQWNKDQDLQDQLNQQQQQQQSAAVPAPNLAQGQDSNYTPVPKNALEQISQFLRPQQPQQPQQQPQQPQQVPAANGNAGAFFGGTLQTDDQGRPVLSPRNLAQSILYKPLFENFSRQQYGMNLAQNVGLKAFKSLSPDEQAQQVASLTQAGYNQVEALEQLGKNVSYADLMARKGYTDPSTYPSGAQFYAPSKNLVEQRQIQNMNIKAVEPLYKEIRDDAKRYRSKLSIHIPAIGTGTISPQALKDMFRTGQSEEEKNDIAKAIGSQQVYSLLGGAVARGDLGSVTKYSAGLVNNIFGAPVSENFLKQASPEIYDKVTDYVAKFMDKYNNLQEKEFVKLGRPESVKTNEGSSTKAEAKADYRYNPQTRKLEKV